MGHFEDRLTAAYQRRMSWYPMNGVLLSDAKEGTMTTPTTPTGKRHLEAVMLGPGSGDETSLVVAARRKTILAIEREAAAAERERLDAICRNCRHRRWEHSGRSLMPRGGIGPETRRQDEQCERLTDPHHTCACGRFLADPDPDR